MKVLKNRNIQDFLWLNGIKPDYELMGVAYYAKSKQLYSLLDKYYIKYTLVPNRLGTY